MRSWWIFVELAPFVDRVAPVLEKYSLGYLSLSDSEFQEAKHSDQELQQILFFNANRGNDYLQEQLKTTKDGDLIYLVVQTSVLTEQEQDQLNHFLATSRSRIKGVMEAEAGLGVLISQINGIKEMGELASEIEMGQEHLEDFEKRLEGVSAHMTAQLHRVEQVHDQMVPLREFHWKGLKTVSKYAPGDSLMSEFWDVVRAEDCQVSLLLSAKDSKSLTCVLHEAISFLGRKSYGKGDLFPFYDSVKKVLGQNSCLFVMMTQMDEMNCFFMADSPLLIYCNGQEVPFVGEGRLNQMKLTKGDRFFVLSSGMVQNYKDEMMDSELQRILKRQWQGCLKSFCRDLFFQAKCKKRGRFHHHDASCFIFEVLS